MPGSDVKKLVLTAEMVKSGLSSVGVAVSGAAKKTRKKAS
jgi:hypothetical protein